MSRSDYTDDCEDYWATICWRGAVSSAMRGKRGQAFLNEMLAALEALPEKKLIKKDLAVDGAVCAIGAVGLARGVDMSKLDAHDSDQVAETFGIAPAMAREIVYMNDERFYRQTPEERFAAMRKWLKDEIWAAKGCVVNPYGNNGKNPPSFQYWKATIGWNEG